MPVPAKSVKRIKSVSGQAMLESLIVMFVVCVLLFGLLQVAIGYTGREVLHHAAARAARARAVGFNDWMTLKAIRVASIPTSGKMLQPAEDAVGYLRANLPEWRTPGDAWDAAFSPAAQNTSRRGVIEAARIPWYMSSENNARASYVLNYSEWERGSFIISEKEPLFDRGTIRVSVTQSFPLEMPFSRVFFPLARHIDENGFPRVSVSGEAEAGDHSSLYLE